jgi:hypothetical protein
MNGKPVESYRWIFTIFFFMFFFGRYVSEIKEK